MLDPRADLFCHCAVIILLTENEGELGMILLIRLILRSEYKHDAILQELVNLDWIRVQAAAFEVMFLVRRYLDLEQMMSPSCSSLCAKESLDFSASTMPGLISSYSFKRVPGGHRIRSLITSTRSPTLLVRGM